MNRNYLITAFRILLRNQKHTFLNVLGLTMGMVVCLLIGIWLQRELTFDDFHEHADNLYRVSNTFKSESESFSQAPSGAALGAQLPKELPSISSACRLFSEGFKVTTDDEQYVERNGLAVDPNFFGFFGFRLKEGQADKVLTMQNQIVLTEKLAVKYFGNVEEAVGKSVLIDGVTTMVVSGVAENPPVNSHIQYDLLLSTEYIRKRAKEEYGMDIDNMWIGGWPHTYIDRKSVV